MGLLNETLNESKELGREQEKVRDEEKSEFAKKDNLEKSEERNPVEREKEQKEKISNYFEDLKGIKGLNTRYYQDKTLEYYEKNKENLKTPEEFDSFMSNLEGRMDKPIQEAYIYYGDDSPYDSPSDYSYEECNDRCDDENDGRRENEREHHERVLEKQKQDDTELMRQDPNDDLKSVLDRARTWRESQYEYDLHEERRSAEKLTEKIDQWMEINLDRFPDPKDKAEIIIEAITTGAYVRSDEFEASNMSYDNYLDREEKQLLPQVEKIVDLYKPYIDLTEEQKGTWVKNIASSLANTNIGFEDYEYYDILGSLKDGLKREDVLQKGNDDKFDIDREIIKAEKIGFYLRQGLDLKDSSIESWASNILEKDITDKDAVRIGDALARVIPSGQNGIEAWGFSAVENAKDIDTALRASMISGRAMEVQKMPDSDREKWAVKMGEQFDRFSSVSGRFRFASTVMTSLLPNRDDERNDERNKSLNKEIDKAPEDERNDERNKPLNKEVDKAPEDERNDERNKSLNKEIEKSPEADGLATALIQKTFNSLREKWDEAKRDTDDIWNTIDRAFKDILDRGYDYFRPKESEHGQINDLINYTKSGAMTILSNAESARDQLLYSKIDSKALAKDDKSTHLEEIGKLSIWNASCPNRSYESKLEVVKGWVDKNLERFPEGSNERKDIVRHANDLLAKEKDKEDLKKKQPDKQQNESLKDLLNKSLSSAKDFYKNVLLREIEMPDILRSREKEKDKEISGLNETREIVRESMSRIDRAIKERESIQKETCKSLRDSMSRINREAYKNPAIQSFYAAALDDVRSQPDINEARNQTRESIKAITDYEKYGLDREVLASALKKKEESKKLSSEEKGVLREYNKLERDVKKIMKKAERIDPDNFNSYRYNRDGRAREIMSLKERSEDEKLNDRNSFIQMQKERLEAAREKVLSPERKEEKEILDKARDTFFKEYSRILDMRSAVERSISKHIEQRDNISEELGRQHVEINRYASGIIDKYKDMIEDYRGTIDTDALNRAQEKIINNSNEALTEDERLALTKNKEAVEFDNLLTKSFESLRFVDRSSNSDGITIDTDRLMSYKNVDINDVFSRFNIGIPERTLQGSNININSYSDVGLELKDRKDIPPESVDRDKAERDFMEKSKNIIEERVVSRDEYMEYARAKVDFNIDERFVEKLSGAERFIRPVKAYLNPLLSRNETERTLFFKALSKKKEVDKQYDKEVSLAERALRPDEVRVARYLQRSGFIPREDEKIDKSIHDFDARYKTYWNLMKVANDNRAEATNEINSFRTEDLKSSYERMERSLQSFSSEEKEYYDSLRIIEARDPIVLRNISDERYTIYKNTKESMKDISERMLSYGNREKEWSSLSKECDPKDTMREERLNDNLKWAKDIASKVDSMNRSGRDDINDSIRTSFESIRKEIEKLPSADSYISDICNREVRRDLEARDSFVESNALHDDRMDPRELETRRLLEKALYTSYGYLEERGLASEKDRQSMNNSDFVFDPRNNAQLLGKDKVEIDRDVLSPRAQLLLERSNIIRTVKKNDSMRDERSFFTRAKDAVFKKIDEIEDVRSERAAKRFAARPFDSDAFSRLPVRAQQIYILSTNDKGDLLRVSQINRFIDEEDIRQNPREAKIAEILNKVRDEARTEAINRDVSRRERELLQIKKEKEELEKRQRQLEKELATQR